MTDEQIDKAAKTLAEAFDYPWDHMPPQGREQMHKHVLAVLDAAKDCRTCANHADCAEKWYYGDSHLVRCKNGDRYQASEPVRLWEK